MTVRVGSRYGDSSRIVTLLIDGVQSLSRRTPISIFESPEHPIYVTSVGDTLWTIAANPDVYGDARYWWVLVDNNDFLVAELFKNFWEGVDAGLRLRIPPLDLIAERIGGRLGGY